MVITPWTTLLWFTPQHVHSALVLRLCCWAWELDFTQRTCKCPFVRQCANICCGAKDFCREVINSMIITAMKSGSFIEKNLNQQKHIPGTLNGKSYFSHFITHDVDFSYLLRHVQFSGACCLGEKLHQRIGSSAGRIKSCSKHIQLLFWFIALCNYNNYKGLLWYEDSQAHAD